MPLVASRANASAKAFGFSAALAGEELGGMVLMTPTSIVSTGTGNSSSINTNGSVTFSSCATLSLNGVFTSEYDNYMISIRYSATTVDDWDYRLRASGTDNTTSSSYTSQYLDSSGAVVNAGRSSNTWARWIYNGNVQRAGSTMHIYGPYLSQHTASRSLGSMDASSAYLFDNAVTHNQSTSYDGITILSRNSTGTLSGLISVYGLGG